MAYSEIVPTSDKINNAQTITSMEVAEMVGKRHDHLIRDIKKYIGEMSAPNFGEGKELKIQSVDFFKESSYVDKNQQKRPCYDITKKGCEFIAHKLTGVKGTEFTARYINRFHEMEDHIKSVDFQSQPEFLLCLQGVKFVADDLHVSTASKLHMYNKTFEEYGLPTSSLPKYEDNGSREQCSATELLDRNQCGMSTVKFNKLLLDGGYLEERERPSSKGGTKKFKALTEKGLGYGTNLINEKNQREVQPYYYADTFMELFGNVYK